MKHVRSSAAPLRFLGVALMFLVACTAGPAAAPTAAPKPAATIAPAQATTAPAPAQPTAAAAPKPTTASQPAAASGDAYRIGAVFALTGPAGPFNVPARNAAQMAMDEINAAGGVKGHKLDIIFEDSKGEPQSGVAALNKVIQVDKVPATLITVSGVVTAAIPVAEQNKQVLLDIATTTPKVAEMRKDYVFSNYPKSDLEGKAEAEFAYKTLGVRSAAILALNTETGQGQRQILKQSFEELGGKIVLDESYSDTEKNFQTLLTRVKAANPDIVLMAHQNEAGLIVKQARELGLTTKFMGYSAAVTEDFLKLAGPAAEGTFASSLGWNPNDTSELVRKFITNYKAKFGQDPIVYSATAYDGVRLLAQAIEQGGYTSEGIKAALYKVKDFQGVSGTTTIQPNGMPVKPVYFKVVKDGKWVDYRP